MIKNIRIFLLIILLLIFSGCETVSISNIFKSSSTEDTTGCGLDVSLNFKTENVDIGRILYEINIKNTGFDKIILTRSNFRLYTLEKLDGQDVITQESIEDFYKSMFEDNQVLELYQNDYYKKSGLLRVKEEFLKNPNFSVVTIILESNYDSHTQMSSNMELLNSYGIFSIKSGSNPKQASEIQLNKITLIPTSSDKDYILKLKLENTGCLKTTDDKISIGKFDVEFSKNPISCTYNEGTDIFFPQDEISIELECPIVIDSKDDFSTQIKADFNYVYKFKLKKEISLYK